jgi:hypothetical protein
LGKSHPVFGQAQPEHLVIRLQRAGGGRPRFLSLSAEIVGAAHIEPPKVIGVRYQRSQWLQACDGCKRYFHRNKRFVAEEPGNGILCCAFFGDGEPMEKRDEKMVRSIRWRRGDNLICSGTRKCADRC